MILTQIYVSYITERELHKLDENTKRCLRWARAQIALLHTVDYKLVAMVTQKEPGLFSRACSWWLSAKLNCERMTTGMHWECKCGTKNVRGYCKEKIRACSAATVLKKKKKKINSLFQAKCLSCAWTQISSGAHSSSSTIILQNSCTYINCNT